MQEAYSRFFAFTRERHSIYLRRQAGQTWPWTDDPILRQYRFTNVFRELDKTTVWFRENIRDPLQYSPDVLLATVLFRWFNRIEVCEVIFGQSNLFTGGTPWGLFRDTGDTSLIRSALISAFPSGPYVTAAYMLRSPEGMSKLDGILSLVKGFYDKADWLNTAAQLLSNRGQITTEDFTNWLREETPGQGLFTAYEVACDLHYTDLLRDAPDRMTWANPGPGAQRGLNRLHGRVDPNPRKAKYAHRMKIKPEQALAEMRHLLALSQDELHWPKAWPAWDMRTVEHSLCEFDKYTRALVGDGKPKQLYRP